ncbi:Cytochrome P450 CYP749A22 [Linum grandiflorum]
MGDLMMQLFFFTLLSVVLVNILRFLNQVWLRPIRIQSAMNSQGIKGPPYRFLHGNTKEINDMITEAAHNPMEISHQMLPRIMPHVHSWTKIYGMNFLNWYGTRPQLVVTDPELVKEVLSNKEGTFPKKFIQSYADKFLGNGLLTSQGEKWIKTRKLAHQAFHGDCLKAMIPAMVTSVEAMLQRWEMDDVKEIDAFPEFKILSSEVISRTAFGSSYMEGKNVFQMLMKLGIIVNRNNYKTGIPGIKKFWRRSDDVESDKLERDIKEAVIKLVNKREGLMKSGSESYGSDFLGSLLNACHDSDLSRKITVDDLVDECKSFYVAGHETVTCSLTWTVLLLAIHTDWQDKAREEVLEMFKQERNPCLDGVSRLKTVRPSPSHNLQAFFLGDDSYETMQMAMIVNESLRLYPPVFNLTREVERETKQGSSSFPQRWH